MKWFLAWHGRAFRKTHDLVELGPLCADIDSALEPMMRLAAILTDHAAGRMTIGTSAHQAEYNGLLDVDQNLSFTVRSSSIPSLGCCRTSRRARGLRR